MGTVPAAGTCPVGVSHRLRPRGEGEGQQRPSEASLLPGESSCSPLPALGAFCFLYLRYFLRAVGTHPPRRCAGCVTAGEGHLHRLRFLLKAVAKSLLALQGENLPIP